MLDTQCLLGLVGAEGGPPQEQRKSAGGWINDARRIAGQTGMTTGVFALTRTLPSTEMEWEDLSAEWDEGGGHPINDKRRIRDLRHITSGLSLPEVYNAWNRGAVPPSEVGVDA